MRRSIALLFLVAFLACGGLASAECRAARGMHVVLFGGVDDPDVFVWDSRGRLVEFAGGSSDTRKFLLPHALLNRPGTRAVVQACLPGAVRSKFRMARDDAVGILILTGQYRGRYGWVISLDLHGPGITEPDDKW